jgi:hypothetical protein
MPPFMHAASVHGPAQENDRAACIRYCSDERKWVAPSRTRGVGSYFKMLEVCLLSGVAAERKGQSTQGKRQDTGHKKTDFGESAFSMAQELGRLSRN